MKNAKDFAGDMEECIAYEGKAFCGYNHKQCTNLIKARDQEILKLLSPFLKHKGVCYKILYSGDTPCSCGVDDAIKAITG